MMLVALAAVVAIALGAAGVRTGRELASGGYRIPEDEPIGPPPGTRMVAPLTAALAAYVTLAVGGLAAWAALPAYLLFAWLVPPVVWIDRDVHRIPVGLVWPAGAATVLLLAIAAVADESGLRWRGALLGALVAGALYGLLWLPRGGLGMGDLRLAPLIGALLGFLGPAQLAVGLTAGFVIGGVQAVVLLLLGRAGRRSRMAFGPAMCAGALVGIGGSDRIMEAMLTG